MNILTSPPPHRFSPGFSAVELMITLFITAMFLFAGFSMYNTVVDYSVDARAQSQASRIAYDYLQRYQSTAAASCSAGTPVDHTALDGTPNAQGLVSPTITIQVVCPLSTVPSLSKIVAHVEYKIGVNLHVVEQEVYASQ